MKINLSLLLFIMVVSNLHAQYKVQFIVKEKTAIQHDSIFVTGTFSNWDSTKNKNYLLLPAGKNKKSITLYLKAGEIKYKFHRGSWLSVEKQANGDEVPDRNISIHKDTILIDSVASWRDEMLADKWYALATERTDSNRIKTLTFLASAYAFYTEYYNQDSALFYARTALQLQQKIVNTEDNKYADQPGYIGQLMNLQEVVATLMHALGNYPKALEIRLENLKLAEKYPDRYLHVFVLGTAATDYISMKDYRHVLSNGKMADSILNTLDKKDSRFPLARWNINNIITLAFLNLQLPDSALPYAKYMTTIKGLPFPDGYLASANALLADISAAKGDNKTALRFYKLAAGKSTDYWAASAYIGMSKAFRREGQLDSALYYAREALNFYQTQNKTVQSWGENSNYFIAQISPIIADIYKAMGQSDSAYKYLQLSVLLKDSLYNSDKVRQFQTLSFNEAARGEQLEQQRKNAQLEYQTKIKMYGLLSGMAFFLLVAFGLYRNNKHKQKANSVLYAQKKEIEKTLAELKTTQQQLIQSEKMASLGELTAGIAHEIQNPLNFVNNFSEVSNELIDEMNEEIRKGNFEEVKAIAEDVQQNLNKINHHGKRADAIVKGMLQHSQNNNGKKEATDINKLADEYLRLAYHGLRAKDKTFNATLKTDFDDSIGNIPIIPQDMGRVILNLITNAFYTVLEKRKQQPTTYDPTVTVSTKKLNDQVLISIEDNGNGIPQKALDKIFQPFFTTKPTGQGTGLGLSMSYDIVTKSHGGTLKVQTLENEGSTFTIALPINN